MNKSTLAAIAVATLALAACQNNQDQVNEIDANSADLNVLADDAADSADEANALANQASSLENEADNTAAPTDNLANQSEADAAVNGM